MSLLRPGGAHAGDVFSDHAVLESMVAVEQAWLATLADAGIAPRPADLTGLVGADDLPTIEAAAGSGGNPVIPLLELLRERAPRDVARWLHRGLTSQDTLDTALVLQSRAACTAVNAQLRALATTLAALADRHRVTAMTGRTLTQPAVPIRFGAKVAGWLHGILDAVDDLDRLSFPAQVGGAAGTLSGVVVLTGGDAQRAVDLASDLATRLDLAARAPWATSRAPVTRVGEAFARATAACGRIANDVLTLGRPEFGEVSGADGGGSSTMPQKANPVLAVLVRRTALESPAVLAQLHLAAADTGDERPAGAWHLEWPALQRLARLAVSSATQTVAVANGLRVDPDRMAANLAAAAGVDAERGALEELAGALPPGTWAGADDLLVDAALARARGGAVREPVRPGRLSP